MLNLKNTLKQKRIALLAGIIITLAVIFIIVFKANPAPEMPKMILHLQLVEEIKGKDARKVINELHHKQVVPPDNMVGKYQSMDGKATLYLSVYATNKDASEQFENMANRIRLDNSAFTHYRMTNISEIKVSLCLGLGQAHYFFVNGDNLLWLAVDIPIAQASVKELVRLTKPVI